MKSKKKIIIAIIIIVAIVVTWIAAQHSEYFQRIWGEYEHGDSVMIQESTD